MNKGPNATIRLVRRQNHAGTTVSWTTVQREKNSHAYKLSSNVQTACSTDSLNNCPKHSILRFSSFALKIYLWLKMCQHNLPCSIVLPTACFPEGPSPHFTFCSFWRRRPRLEAVNYNYNNNIDIKKINSHWKNEWCPKSLHLATVFWAFIYYRNAFCVACEARMAHRAHDSGGGVVGRHTFGFWSITLEGNQNLYCLLTCHMLK